MCGGVGCEWCSRVMMVARLQSDEEYCLLIPR